jgi:menaquinone-dependent protoporphyrinogen oxidase
MEPMVLVVYATRYGSSEEVALAVADVLRESGLSADLQPAANVTSVDGYSAVVLVAALYMFRLHKEAKRFLERNHVGLAALPVALFVLGPVNKVAKEFAAAGDQLDKELAKFPWLKPVVKPIVGGRFDPASLGFPLKYLPALRKMPVSNALDFAAIREQTRELAGKLNGAALASRL